MQSIQQEKLLIIDFGSQYTQLIARRIREQGVYSEILSWRTTLEQIIARQPKGIILSGGPESTTGNNVPKIVDGLIDLDIPVLGICYGMQAMAQQYGGSVQQSSISEFGHAEVSIQSNARLFQPLIDAQQSAIDVWMSHGDKVKTIGDDFEVVATTKDCPIAAIQHKSRPVFGIQFHPEVTHTQGGSDILKHFAISLCGCSGQWRMDKIIEESIESIRNQVGTDSVTLGLSGGVDSSVTAMLLHRAIGSNLTCIFIDNGLLRKDEGDQVMQMFANHSGLNVIRIKAQQRFLSALASETDPEQKRKIIGNTFIEVFDEEAAKLDNVKWLGQGTIYPDVIESAGSDTGHAHVIKSHHNVGGLPENMTLRLVEPLRNLFKDEVRKIGVQLGLSETMLYRHPFPGPGLGVRILGAIKQEYADILREADAIFIDALIESGWYDKVSQAFTVFLPVKSVGVVGDSRRYEYVVALRAVETIDFMTARWAHLPYDLLEKVSNQILNSISGISRVTYDISSKPPATIEWE